MIPPEDPAAPGAATETLPDTSGATDKLTPAQSMTKWLRDSGITSPPQDAETDDGEERPAETPPKVSDKPKPAPKADDKPKGGDAPPPEPPIRVRGKTVTRPALPIEERRPEPVKKVEEDKPDPKWEESLEQSEKDIMAEAREVERLLPEKHKGLSGRTAKFVRDHQKYVTDQGDDFDENSAEYKEWLAKNQPQLSRDDMREVEAVRVESRVRQKYDPEVANLRHELFVRDEEPKVAQEGQRLYAELETLSVPAEVLEAIRKEGFEKVAGVGGRYRLEIETAQAVLTTAVEDFKELTRLSTVNRATGKSMAEEATDPANPRFEQHERLRGLVKAICDDFLKNGAHTDQFKDGKWFVTREEYNQIPAAKRGGYWTFTNAQIIAQAKGAVKSTLNEAIRTRREYMEQRGFKRQNGAPAPVIPNKEPPKPTPRIPSPAAAPGPTDEPADGNHLGRRLVGVLNRDVG